MTAGERNKLVALEKVEDALPKQIRNNAYVISKVKSIPKMYAFVAVVLVVGCQCGEHSEFYPRCVSVLLYRSDDFDCDIDSPSTIERFDDFAECSLA